MSFKNLLSQAKESAEGFIDQHKRREQGNTTTPATYPQPGAPPIPPNKPSSSIVHATPYWAPRFDGSSPVSHDFIHELGAHGWGNNELQNYVSSSDNCFHHEARLILRAIAYQGNYTSARLKSRQHLDRQRGSLRVHASPPCATGVWPAFWMLPSDPFQWPNEGEIDIIETWNSDLTNHSCLHWGNYNGEDWNKHRVIDTHMPDMARAKGGHTYEFVWDQPENGQGGRLLWYIDGRAVMKASVPQGTRRMSDWMIIINVAMGGNVCQGKTPQDGYYDFVIYSLGLFEEPRAGWRSFESDFQSAPEGHTM